MTTRVIKVTPLQVWTAKWKLKRDKELGRESDPAVIAIANARSEHASDDGADRR